MAGGPTASSTSRAAATPRRSGSRTSTSPTSTPRRAASARSWRTSAIDPADARAGPRLRRVHGEHPRRLPAALHQQQLRPTGMRRAPEERDLPDGRRVRRPAADRRLTRDQAMYHFISGYTAKLAGTEVGVTEPKATFSTCFGAPFMPRHPGVYARDAGRAPGCATTCRSGWSTPAGRAGPTASAQRMNISHTRAMVHAALDGRLEGVRDRHRPDLRLRGPRHLPGRPRRAAPATGHLARH